MKFQRKPLRDDIQKEILGRIVDGSLPAGRRINETHLAEDLGLSRTPLREAMLTLSAAGFLNSDMGKGFAVPELDPAELAQIQEMLALLQPLALSQTVPLPSAQIMEIANHLSRARMRLEPKADDKAVGLALAGLVFNWNEILLRNCANPVLLADINRLEGLAARYWFAAGMRGLDTDEMCQSFNGIYELLRQDQGDQACQVWSSHIEKFGKMAVQRLHS